MALKKGREGVPHEQLFNGQIILVCETNKSKMSFIIFWFCKPHNVWFNILKRVLVSGWTWWCIPDIQYEEEKGSKLEA